MLTRGYGSARRTRQRKGNVEARLFELERIYGAAIAEAQARAGEDASAETRELIRAVIANRGVEQQPSESLSDAFARCSG
jgi:hypothetical protein